MSDVSTGGGMSMVTVTFDKDEPGGLQVAHGGEYRCTAGSQSDTITVNVTSKLLR